MEHVLAPQPGYPFTLALGIEYALSEQRADGADDRDEHRRRAAARTEPARTRTCRLGAPTVDPLTLRVPARTVLQSDERGPPDRASSGRGDGVRLPQPASDRRDEARQRVHRSRAGDDGRLARVELARSVEGDGASPLWVDEGYRYVMVFSGDPLPDVARRSSPSSR